MSIYRSAYNAILSLKRFAKKDGGTDEDINGAIDYATNFLRKPDCQRTQNRLF